MKTHDNDQTSSALIGELYSTIVDAYTTNFGFWFGSETDTVNDMLSNAAIAVNSLQHRAEMLRLKPSLVYALADGTPISLLQANETADLALENLGSLAVAIVGDGCNLLS